MGCYFETSRRFYRDPKAEYPLCCALCSGEEYPPAVVFCELLRRSMIPGKRFHHEKVDLVQCLENFHGGAELRLDPNFSFIAHSRILWSTPRATDTLNPLVGRHKHIVLGNASYGVICKKKVGIEMNHDKQPRKCRSPLARRSLTPPSCFALTFFGVSSSLFFDS